MMACYEKLPEHIGETRYAGGSKLLGVYLKEGSP